MERMDLPCLSTPSDDILFLSSFSVSLPPPLSHSLLGSFPFEFKWEPLHKQLHVFWLKSSHDQWIDYLGLVAVDEQNPSTNDALWLATSKLRLWIHTSTLSYRPWHVSTECILPSCCHADVWLQIRAIKAQCYYSTEPLNVFNAEQEGGRKRKNVHAPPCLFLWLTNGSVVGVPSGGRSKVNWMHLQLSQCGRSLCVDNRMAARVNFLHHSAWTTDNVSEQLFVRCCSLERCVILDAVTAKTEMTLKRWRKGEGKRTGREVLWRYEGRWQGRRMGETTEGESTKEEITQEKFSRERKKERKRW